MPSLPTAMQVPGARSADAGSAGTETSSASTVQDRIYPDTHRQPHTLIGARRVMSPNSRGWPRACRSMAYQRVSGKFCAIVWVPCPPQVELQRRCLSVLHHVTGHAPKTTRFYTFMRLLIRAAEFSCPAGQRNYRRGIRMSWAHQRCRRRVPSGHLRQGSSHGASSGGRRTARRRSSGRYMDWPAP